MTYQSKVLHYQWVQIDDKENSRAEEVNGIKSVNDAVVPGSVNIATNWEFIGKDKLKFIGPEELQKRNGKGSNEPEVNGDSDKGTDRLDMYVI